MVGIFIKVYPLMYMYMHLSKLQIKTIFYKLNFTIIIKAKKMVEYFEIYYNIFNNVIATH